MKKIILIMLAIVMIGLIPVGVSAYYEPWTDVAQKVLARGKECTLDYVIITDHVIPLTTGGAAPTGPFVTSQRRTCKYTVKGIGYGDGYWEYQSWFLMSRDDWEDMYDKCMPNGVSRSLGLSKIKYEKFQMTGWGTTRVGNRETPAVHFRIRENVDDLVEHHHVFINEQNYTLIQIEDLKVDADY